jgi:hypothetical protein
MPALFPSLVLLMAAAKKEALEDGHITNLKQSFLDVYEFY